ncbi:MAG: hypothetical protein O7G32_11560, partial [SAR324 cluster bacterium]|nr:hypothetical protein [SAR324 cluster bacterium]
MNVKANYIEQVLGENQDALYAIREIPHFKHSSEELLKLIYTYGRVYALREGEQLTREGEFDQWVFFVLNGKLAVYVGEEWVDTISSSLVGERCILGEPRKATLSAGEGGVTALGVDMAILDTLESAGGHDPQKFQVYGELLSIITGEIINRIADLAYNQLEISNKLAINVKSEAVTDVINGFLAHEYRGRPEVNMAIYKFLARKDRVLLGMALESDKITVDTRKLFALCVNSGRTALTLELANLVHDFSLEDSQALEEDAGHYTEQFNFYAFVGQVYARIIEQYGATKFGQPGGRPLRESAWRQKFRLRGSMSVDLANVCIWLKSAYRFTDLEIVEALRFMLHEASAYTDQINMANRQIMIELSRIKVLQKLDSIVNDSEKFTPQFYDSKTLEEMIPEFSKQILEVHLIKPYMERLEQAGLVEPPRSPPAGTEATAQPE